MKTTYTLTGNFTCFVLFFWAFQTNGQAWMPNENKAANQPANFYQIQQSFNKQFYTQWQGQMAPGKGKIIKGKGYKQFKRWEWFWEPRVGKEGVFPKSSVVMEEWRKYQANHPEAKFLRDSKPLRDTERNNLEKNQAPAPGSTTNPEGSTTPPPPISSNGNWKALGPGSSTGGYSGLGRLNAIGFHPTDANTFWVGSPAGGLWKTTSGGSSWMPLTDNIPVIGVSGIAVDYTNPNILYIATGDGNGGDTYSVGVLKSTNGGASWNTTGLSYVVASGVTIKALVIHPTNPAILIAATSGGIYRTTNSGTSWTLEKSGTFQEIKFKPGTPSTVYASSVGNAQVFRSTNTGDTWTQETSFSGVYRIALAVSAANSSVVGALCTNNTNYGFAGYYRSTNSGDSFSSVYLPGKNLLGWAQNGSDTGGQGWYDLCLAMSPNNSNIIYAGGVNTWKSTDGGSTWTINTMWYGGTGVAEVHADKHVLAYHPLSSSTLFQGNDGGLYKTTNGGSTWTDLSNSLQITQFYRMGNSATNSDLTIAGAQDNGTKIRNSSTYTDVIGGDGMECIIDYSNASVMYGTLYYGDIYKSTNGGTSFTNISGSLPAGAWVTPYVMDPVNPQILYAGYTNVYKTTNGGTSWSAISTNLTSGAYLQSLAVAPSNTQTIYAATYYAFYKTTNGGTSWSTITLPNNFNAVSSIEVSPSDPNTLWITYSGYGSGIKVFRSDNGGTSWTNISGTLPNLPANTIEYDKNTGDLYLGTDVGVFVRSYGMSDWQTFDVGLPNVIVTELEIQYSSKRLRASTYGRGLWESDLFNNQVQANPYCRPIATVGCPSDYINNFSLNTLVNNNSGCNGEPNGYTAYYPSGSLTTTVKTGQSYTISMQAGGTLSQGFGVWIDYNDDQDFDDSGEFVYASPSAGTGTFTGTITIPATASTGLRRMRVKCKYSSTITASESCASYTWGETEDYTIAVGYCVPNYAALCGSGDYIDNFSFNTLANNSSGCNGLQSNYINYPPTGALTTTVMKGQSYPISMQSGPVSQGFGVWIDYNNDQDFNDAGEFIYDSPTAGTGVYSGTVTIPAGASSGPRRLRVRARWNNVFTSGQACDNFTWGETEDYTVSVADPISSIWDYRFGGSGTDSFAEAIKTSDGGYLLGGTSASGTSGDKTQSSRGSSDYWIVKINSSGTKVWDKRFGGSASDQLYTIIQTADGGYLLGGRSWSGISGDRTQSSRGNVDYWIVKISSTGTKQWDKRFGGSGFDDLRKVHQLSTGEYILAGYSDSPVSGDKTQSSRGGLDYWVLKVSSSGTKLWDKRFGGSATDFLAGMAATSDGGYLLAGESASGVSGDKTQSSRGAKDYWVVKINSSGTKVWDKRFGGSADDLLNSVIHTSDGGYVLAGESASGVSGDKTQSSQGAKDYWVVKINSSGTKVWDKRFGGSADDNLASVVQASDGSYLLGGTSASGISGDKTQVSQGSTDYWAVKITSSGTKQWDKRFGGSAAEVLGTVLATTDGNYLLGGHSASGAGGDKTQTSRGGTDYWVVKVSPAGGPLAAPAAIASEMDPAAIQMVSAPAIEEVAGKSAELRARPNPFSTKVTASFTVNQAQTVYLKVYDSQGKEVATLYRGAVQAGKTYEFEWQPSTRQAVGMYILLLQTNDQLSRQKIILAR